MRALLILLLGCLVLPLQAAPSASSAQPALPAAYQEPFSAAAIGQLILGLLLVLAVIFLFFWLLRRFSGISPMAKNMQVLGVLPLSAREKAVLVKVGDKQLLLGVAPGRVNHLCSFEGEVVDTSEKPESFASRLGEALQRRQEKSTDE
ncbi:flagellar biosynthetic protein FliO [Neptuniibacter halophilus]|uniref:flagellar biosynthetic protein FliO n=1 Tax=Neptuniibacter halophilus TaxID=651666 RepID=UPI002572F230|nr:flagellar biosynthetic protein FliO [Neptuniibacter halophilus]